MNSKDKYKKIISKDIEDIQKAFTTRKIIKNKLIPYYFDKPLLYLNNSDNISSNALNNQDDVIQKNNIQYDEKIYDGKQLSKVIHKKLENFNLSYHKNMSLYESYKSTCGKFTKNYFFCKHLKKSNSEIYFDNNNIINNEAMIDLIDEYKRKKNYNINNKSLNRDLYSNSALVDNNPNRLKLLYIFNPSKLIKKSNSETNKKNHKNENNNCSTPYSLEMKSIKNLKDYKYIIKIKSLVKKKLKNSGKNRVNNSFNYIKNKKSNIDQSKKKSIINEKFIKKQIIKYKKDINLLNKTIKSLNEETKPKKYIYNNQAYKLLYSRNAKFSKTNNTCKYIQSRQINKLPFLSSRSQNSKNNTINYGNSTKYTEELNKSDMSSNIKNNIINIFQKKIIQNHLKNQNNNNNNSNNVTNINKISINQRRNSLINLKSSIILKSRSTLSKGTKIINFDKSNNFLKEEKNSNTLSPQSLNITPNQKYKKYNKLKSAYIDDSNSKTTNKDLLHINNIEDLYKFAKDNINDLAKEKIWEKVEKIFKSKKILFEKKNENNNNYINYLKNLSYKINQYDIRKSMRKAYNIMGQKMMEQKRSKIKEVSDLEDKIQNKGKELLFSLVLKNFKANISE